MPTQFHNKVHRMPPVKLFVASLLTLFALSTFGTQAQVIDGYPTQPIKLVVPFPPGGASDIIARIVGQRLAEYMKATIVIENKAGANGNIAAEDVVRSKPAGFHLIYTSSSVALSPVLYKYLSFDIEKDLAVVVLSTVVPMLLNINNSLPDTNLL